MQRGVAKGLKVPCLFMITEVSIRYQKTPEVGIRRIPAYTSQYTTEYTDIIIIRQHTNTNSYNTSKYTIAVRSVSCHAPIRELTWHTGSHSRSWYSIKRPPGDARLSWPSWLATRQT